MARTEDTSRTVFRLGDPVVVVLAGIPHVPIGERGHVTGVVHPYDSPSTWLQVQLDTDPAGDKLVPTTTARAPAFYFKRIQTGGC